jgi:hypothetical protein
MLASFFHLAALSPIRQLSFRRAVVAHLTLLLFVATWSFYRPGSDSAVIAYFLLTAGIVEGAGLAGWRLAQLPKSQALEFLLVTPMHPRRVFLAEASVGLALLALVTLSGLPILILLVLGGRLSLLDLAPLLAMPFTWGAITGLGLTLWAYEALWIRRWGERLILVLIVVYLAVGVLAGEHLASWVRCLPGYWGALILNGLEASHRYNPFSVLQFWMTEGIDVAVPRMLGVELGAIAVVLLLLGRSACRMQPHFHDRHYAPVMDTAKTTRRSPGDAPLTWWAVRRVTEYSGRVNLWLAGGFGCLYAVYTMAGTHWPAWLGRSVFAVFDNAGGVPLWATALIVLAAVPAAFQYGLWDSNAQDRCRRLELLLMTELWAGDYWAAAAHAAWRRGRGYFGVAVILWLAALVSGSIGFTGFLAAVATAVALWGFCFALGYHAFSSGTESNRLGLFLTIGLPALAFVLYQFGQPALAALVPPGSVYFAVAARPGLSWCWGSAATCIITLWIGRQALARCDCALRAWYSTNHGKMVLE